MNNAALRDKVLVPKEEYLRLKHLDKLFRDFLMYTEHLTEIREARKEVKNKKIISQEELFSQLGF